ncbi:hypothetical protein D779_1254 [Imhoffiella purpurea]|uniref:Uncharacterized protein n=1 Tax=Imhoffiella purpurea TaxID=1249627 RepID=W9VHJ2_9GAMM|nr:hypothetical protein D779_1254 [Imhoffiella purpurea]
MCMPRAEQRTRLATDVSTVVQEWGCRSVRTRRQSGSTA